jgi:hypothetical protein
VNLKKINYTENETRNLPGGTLLRAPSQIIGILIKVKAEEFFFMYVRSV